MATRTKSATKQAPLADPLIGQKVPDWNLPLTGVSVKDETLFRLKDYPGYHIVLFFYPKDMTSGCTQEGHDFSDRLNEFKKNKTLVFGISRDSLARHEKFIAKENYRFPLISDEDETACRWFDVIKEKNMYGKKVMGIERSTFVIDQKARIIKTWRKVKVTDHAQEVLDFIKQL